MSIKSQPGFAISEDSKLQSENTAQQKLDIEYVAPQARPEEDYDFISSLDPLQVDSFMNLVPAFNENGDIKSLQELLQKMLPSLEASSRFTYHEAAAAMRDIGILLGSLKRHNLEPVEVVPQCEGVLLLLGEKLQTPPRDTLLSYSLWNPADPRQRSYTGFAEENQLIANIRHALLSLEESVRNLAALHKKSPLTFEFAEICEKAMGFFMPMMDAVLHRRKNAFPEFSDGNLRNYFLPIFLKGFLVQGPEAMQFPVMIIEYLLWSCDNTDLASEEPGLSPLPYISPLLREIYAKFSHQPSLLKKVQRQIENTIVYDKHLHKSARSLLKFCMLVTNFKKSYQRLANQSSKTRLATKPIEISSESFKPIGLSQMSPFMFSILNNFRDAFENKVWVSAEPESIGNPIG